MQKQKIARKPDSNTLLDSYIAQSIKICSDFADVPVFSILPGMSKTRRQIETDFLTPLKSKHAGMSRKLIIRGPTGSGKSFLVQSVCKEAQFSILNCKAANFYETVKTAKFSFQNILVNITDLEYVKDHNVIHGLCNALTRTNFFVIAEVRGRIDSSLEKFGLFENQISLESYDREDRVEVISYYLDRFSHIFGIQTDRNTSADLFCDYMPADTPSCIAVKLRRVFTRAYSEGCTIDKKFLETFFNQKPEDGITFESIGGLYKVKEDLQRMIIHPLLFRDRYKKYGIKTCGGILLHGPPGCGKTLLAQALANTAKCQFISIKGPELMSKYVGETEKRLRDLFERARKLAPSIMFFDEIDSVCSYRGRSEHSDRVVNQLLVLMDGFDSRGDVMLIGATNRIDQIDEAFLRPGRFDKTVEIPLPDSTERYHIFKALTSALVIPNENFQSLDTEGLTGADIYGIVKNGMLSYIQSPDVDENTIDFAHFQNAYLRK